MENPFSKRATEFYRDDEAFLAVISPEPMRAYFLKAATDKQLFEKLIIIRGTPGSGKTTMARIFEFPTLNALMRNSSIPTHSPLVDILTQCGALDDAGRIAVLAARLPLETDYRGIWEFAYPDHIKSRLTSTLIQARAVLAWLRYLDDAGYSLDDVSIEPRPDADAATAAIGGTSGHSLLDRARTVERALYSIAGALLPPELSELDATITRDVYCPFDVIDHFVVGPPGEQRRLRPLVMLDDAHSLAPPQLAGLQHLLVRREIRVARWVLTRLDVLHPKEAFAALTEEKADERPAPSVTPARDFIPIMLQGSGSGEQRKKSRTAFRKSAVDIAGRYLRQMPVFYSRNLGNLQDLLGDQVGVISKTDLADLTRSVESAKKRLSISDALKGELLAAIDEYQPRLSEDVRLAMLRILMHRMEKRRQVGLFDMPRSEPASKLPTVDAGIQRAAELHLMHRHGRPYYFGMNHLCDASSENAEQFLRLASELVELASVSVIRGKSALLDPDVQHRALRDKATRVILAWDFARARSVTRLIDALAKKCLDKSLEPNAPLDAGANAYGILQDDFNGIPEKRPDLAQVLQIAIANNAISVVPHYNQGYDKWCLLELGGFAILRHGLTLRRGGFIEGTSEELASLAREAGE